MKLKTYRANNMADALSQVKKDLGKDAVILHTRMFKAGGFLGFGAKSLVEVTASDGVNINSALKIKDRAADRKSERSIIPAVRTTAGTTTAAADDRLAAAVPVNNRVAAAYGAVTKTAANSGGSAGTAVIQSARTEGRGNGITASVSAALDEATIMPVHNRRPGVTLDDDQASSIRQVAKMAVGADGQSQQIHAELAVIRRMVGQVLQTSARAGAAVIPGMKMSDALLKHYSRLIENEVAQEVADEVVAAVRDELTPTELADDGIVRLAVLRRLETLLPVCENVAAPGPTPDGRPLTIALIGPTGVGKTTTIAKLAAAYRLRHGKRVTLITSDTYRIAAVDQLRTYANIIGVPLRVVHNPAEMQAAIDASRDCDVVLIDTAGRSPGDGQRLEELAAFMNACAPHQTHLVLSSVSSEAAMMRTAEKFGSLKPNLLIFTKLDEAANLGVLVNVARRVNARLSYVTTGQEVPDDIEAGRADRLARLVLDGRNAP